MSHSLCEVTRLMNCASTFGIRSISCIVSDVRRWVSPPLIDWTKRLRCEFHSCRKDTVFPSGEMRYAHRAGLPKKVFTGICGGSFAHAKGVAINSAITPKMRARLKAQSSCPDLPVRAWRGRGSSLITRNLRSNQLGDRVANPLCHPC